MSDHAPRTETVVAVDLSPRQITDVLGEEQVFAELLELSLDSEVRFDTLASLLQPELATIKTVKSRYAKLFFPIDVPISIANLDSDGNRELSSSVLSTGHASAD